MADWPHAPIHQLDEAGTYMVTAGTYLKKRLFDTPERVQLLHDRLLELALEFGWALQAWAVFSNHYHIVAISPEDAKSLKPFQNKLHTTTAIVLNDLDKTPGRTVWYQYWESHITYQRSFLARLRYVHENAVHHRLVDVAHNYPWCSAGWFGQTASLAFQKTVASFKTDKLNVMDDY